MQKSVVTSSLRIARSFKALAHLGNSVFIDRILDCTLLKGFFFHYFLNFILLYFISTLLELALVS